MIYAIGDIHGQVTMLRNLLEQLEALPLRDFDQLLFLGDYIDRGEDSCAVVETLLAVRERHPNTLFLRGNHEQLLLEARKDTSPEAMDNGYVAFGEKMELWLVNGGADTLLSYGLTNPLCWWESIPEAHWKFYQETLLEHQTFRYHFVHAGLLPPGETWEGEEYGLDPRLWIREPFLSSKDDFSGQIVVFGHTPQLTGQPLLQKNKIGLDTAAVFGGPLTAAAFDPEAPGRRAPHPKFYSAEYARSGG